MGFDFRKSGKRTFPSCPNFFYWHSELTSKKNILTVYYSKFSFLFQSFSYTPSELPKQSFLNCSWKIKYLPTYFPKQEYLCFLPSSQWRRRSWLLEWHQSRKSGEPPLILLLLLAMPVCLLHLSSGIHQQATSFSLLPSAKYPLSCKELGKQLCCHRNTLKQ